MGWVVGSQVTAATNTAERDKALARDAAQPADAADRPIGGHTRLCCSRGSNERSPSFLIYGGYPAGP
jgi:hypothetical protein